MGLSVNKISGSIIDFQYFLDVFWRVLDAQGQQIKSGSNVAKAVTVPDTSRLGKLKRMRKLANGKNEIVEQKATLFAAEIELDFPTTSTTTRGHTVLVRTEATRTIKGKRITIRTKLRNVPAGGDAAWLSFNLPKIAQFKAAIVQRRQLALQSTTSA